MFSKLTELFQLVNDKIKIENYTNIYYLHSEDSFYFYITMLDNVCGSTTYKFRLIEDDLDNVNLYVKNIINKINGERRTNVN